MAFLTIQLRGGKQGQARVTPVAKIPQTDGIRGRRMTARGRACACGCSLSVPSSVGGRASHPSSAITGEDVRLAVTSNPG